MPSTLSKKVSKAEFLISCSESELTTYRTKISLIECVGDGMAYLVGKEIQIEREVVYAIIERLLAGLALSLNIGKNLEPHQLSGLAKKIYAKYYYLSFDEIMHVFDKGSCGSYGKLYDRIDEEIIFSWLEKFDVDERILISEKSNSDEIKEFKIQQKEHDEFLAKHLSKYTEKLSQELGQEKIKEENYKKFREQYFSKNT